MRQTESVRLIPAKKGVLLFAILLLFVANALKAQNFEKYQNYLSDIRVVDITDSTKEMNHFRLYITEPTNNADSVIDVVTKYDSIMLLGKLRLLTQVLYYDTFETIRYGFIDSNTKYIEVVYKYSDRCVKIQNPFHLVNSDDDFFGTKLLSTYREYRNDDYTLRINKKIYEKATMTIIEKRRFSKRFPAVDIVYFNDKLLYIDFYEVKY